MQIAPRLKLAKKTTKIYRECGFDWIDKTKLTKLPYIDWISFNNRNIVVWDKEEQNFIREALLDYYNTNIQFRQLIDGVIQTAPNCNNMFVEILRVMFATHISDNDIHPHFTFTLDIFGLKSTFHAYWNTKIDNPKIYAMSMSGTIK